MGANYAAEKASRIERQTYQTPEAVRKTYVRQQVRFTAQMAQIRVRGRVESLFKVRNDIIVSLLLTLLIVDSRLDVAGIYHPPSSFIVFFAGNQLLVVYATMIGLLLAAYSIMVAMLPNFESSSLKQPIFGQVNRLFLFTILNGILLMIISFVNTVSSINTFWLFIDAEVFFFITLLMGLVFCVLSLSDVFSLVRNRGQR